MGIERWASERERGGERGVGSNIVNKRKEGKNMN